MDSKQSRIPSLREIAVLVLLALPLVVTASAIESAHWVKGMPSLNAVALVPLLLWALLARSRLSWWIVHPVAVVGSVVAAFILAAFSLSGTAGLGGLADQLGSWFGAIGTTAGDRGAALTGVFLIGLMLLIGHASVWLAYRRASPVAAVLPSLSVLLVVLTFLPSDFHWYFFIYFLAAAPGIAVRQGGHWNRRGLRLPLAGALVVAPLLMAVVVLPTWRSPAPEGIVIPLSDQMEKPLYAFRSGWSNLFYGVPNRRDFVFYSPPTDLTFVGPIDPVSEIPFGASPSNDETTLFVVESERPYRWRMRVYDTYTPTGWSSRNQPAELIASDAPLEENVEGLLKREPVDIGIRIYSKTNTLVNVGEPMEVSGVVTEAVYTAPLKFTLYLEGLQREYLPSDVMDYRSGLVDWMKSGVTSSRRRQLVETPGFLPGDLNTSDSRLQRAPADEGPGNPASLQSIVLAPVVVGLERNDPNRVQPMALLSGRVLAPPKPYRTKGSISVYSYPSSEDRPEDLRRAPQEYPRWVTDRYLQLPVTFPDSVKQKARDLTEKADNPYDKAEAIRRYLVSIPYSLDVVLPPVGRDYVEFFLFNDPPERRRGFCQNYASAMITMLRSLGIPARLVVGFAPGIRDEDRGVWVVQNRHYHAWSEVYFPDYGWVEFEPTPAGVQESLGSLGGNQGGIPQNRDPLDICLDILPTGFCDETAADDDLDLELAEFLADLERELIAEAGASGGGSGGLTSGASLLVIILLVALTVPVGFLSYSWIGLSRLPSISVTYASMGFFGRLAGLAARPQETPWEYRDRLVNELPERGEDIALIAGRYAASRYSSPSERIRLSGEERWSVRGAWSRVRRALIGRAFVRLIPRSRRPSLRWI